MARAVFLPGRFHLYMPDRGDRLQQRRERLSRRAGGGARRQRRPDRDAPLLDRRIGRHRLPAAQRRREKDQPRVRRAGREGGRQRARDVHSESRARGELSHGEPHERRPERRGDAARLEGAPHRTALPGRLAAGREDRRVESKILTRMALDEIQRKREIIESRARVREFVFGIQDGLMSTVGLLAGIQGATENNLVVIITGLTAMFAGAVSMATGSYLSSNAEKEIFDKEIQ